MPTTTHDEAEVMRPLARIWLEAHAKYSLCEWTAHDAGGRALKLRELVDRHLEEHHQQPTALVPNTRVQ